MRNRGQACAEGLLAGAAFAAADACACGLPLDVPALPAWIAASGLALGLLSALAACIRPRPGIGAGVAACLAQGAQWSAIAAKEWLADVPGIAAAAVLAAVAVAALAAGIGAARFVRASGRVAAAALPMLLVPASSLVSASGGREISTGIAAAIAPGVLLALVAAWLDRRASRAGAPRPRFEGSKPAALAALAGLAALWLAGRPDLAPRAHTPAAGAPAPRPDAPDLLLVIVDTLRADAVRAGAMSPGTPGFDRLAASGVELTQVIASAGWTLPSHGSLFTGLAPAEHGARTPWQRVRSGLPTLASLLHEAGWTTAAFTGGGFLTAASGMADGFEHFDEHAELHSHADARHVPLVMRVARNRWRPLWPIVNSVPRSGGLARVARRAAEWLGRRDRGRPFFAFLHTYQVHDYFAFQADWDRWIPPRTTVLGARPRFAGRFAGRLWLDPDEIAGREFVGFGEGMYWVRHDPLDAEEVGSLRATYANRVRLVDAELSRFVERVRTLSSGRPLVIAVASDHGEGFDSESERLMHGGRLHDDLLRVPCIVSAPGLLAPGARFLEQVRLLDLMPTLLELAGVAPPPEIDGVSWLARARAAGGLEAGSDPRVDRDPRFAWSEDADGDARTFALRTEEWKAIRRRDELEVYRLGSDPLERETAPDSAPTWLLERLEALAEIHRPAAAELAELDAATLAELRALGYIE